MQVFVFVVLLTLASRVFSRPNGAPPEACSTLVPQHPNNVPREGRGSFELDTSSIPSVGYDPGNAYRLTLRSTDVNVTFRGFILQARTTENNLVGSFEVVSSKTRLQECQLSGEDPVSPAGTITHSNRDDVSSVDLLWIAPPAGTLTVQFIYSVVSNYSLYWVLIRDTRPLFENTGAVREIPELHYFECGTKRACYRDPYNCRDATCKYAALWKVDEEAGVIEVEMLHNRRGWIALGFSDDDLMGDDDVFVCQSHVDGNSVIVKDTYNGGRYEPNMGEADQSDIVFMEWANYDSLILCRFRRTLSGGGNGTFDKDLSTGMYYNFFALGESDSNSAISGVGQIHADVPKITADRRSPADVSKVEIKRPNTALLKAHGALMMFTWYFLAPCGIFLAFFYKEAFPNGLWFYGHIAVMITTIVFMLAGLIVILVHADGKWIQTDGNQFHQVIGIITIAAPGLNAILGIFKGNPDGNYRWLFNLVHGTNGFVLALFLGMINIILGLFRFNIWTEMENRHLVRKSLYLCGSSIGFISMILFIFNVYRLLYHKRIPRPQDSVTSDEDTKELVQDDEPVPSPDYVCRISLGIVMVIIMLGLAIATIVLMAIS